MAVTYEEIKGYLDSEGIKYLWVEEGAYLATGFNTSIYRRDDGTPNLGMAIKLEEDGEYFKLVAPKVYVFKAGPTKLAFWQTLLMICWKTKLLGHGGQGRVRIEGRCRKRRHRRGGVCRQD